MRRVQNRNYAATELHVSGTVYRGDNQGVFRMAPDHADLVVGTSGWEALDAPVPVPPAQPKASKPKGKGKGPQLPPHEPNTEPPAPASPDGLYAPLTGAQTVDDEEADTGPDLEKLGYEELRKVAASFKIEVPADMPESDLRKLLDQALYGDD